MTSARGEGGPAGPAEPAVVRGLGIDAVDVQRFRRVIARRPSMVRRVFTDTERADAARVKDPAPRLERASRRKRRP